MRILQSFLCLSLAAGAQIPAMRPSAQFYLHDAVSRSIRPLIGQPGSSYPGAAAWLDVEWASISPEGTAGLLAAGSGFVFARDLGDRDTAVPIDLEGSPKTALWSRDGKRAVLLVEGVWRLVWIDLRATTPIIEREQALETGGWRLLAADARGEKAILAQSTDPARDQIWVAPRSGALMRVDFEGRNVAAAFDAKGRGWLAGVGGAITALETETGATETRISPEPVTEAPVCVHAGASMIQIVDRGARRVRSFDAATGAAGPEIELHFEPNACEAFAGGMILLHRPGGRGQPYQVWDAAGTSKVLFIPAVEEETANAAK